MTYRTQAAEDLVDSYQRQSAMFKAKAAKEKDRFGCGVYTGYADAFALAAEWAIRDLEKVEQEARLVPDHEEDVMSYAERLIAEAFPGDYRDMPA